MSAARRTYQGIECAAIPPHQIPAMWPTVEPDIARAMEHGRGDMDAEDIEAALLSGQMLLMVFYRGDEHLASVVAELIDKPRHRVCHIVAAGGKDADDWLDVWWDRIQDLAREQGAKQIFVSGRKGWERQLRPYGFEHAYTVIARDI